MTEVENLVLDHLRHIRSAVDSVPEDIREIKGRLGILESQYAHMSTASTVWMRASSGSSGGWS